MTGDMFQEAAKGIVIFIVICVVGSFALGYGCHSCVVPAIKHIKVEYVK